MSTRTVAGAAAHVEIRAFVVAVERALDDLPADDVTELVGGLEADLTEAWVTEGTTPAERFGTPEAYAGELRAAAGLPSRDRAPKGLAASARSVARDARATVTALPGWPAVRDLAVTLRPVWWALRGYAAYLVLAQLVTLGGMYRHAVPSSWLTWSALVGLVLASVEFGRRTAGMRSSLGRGLVIALNAALLITLWAMAPTASAQQQVYSYESDPAPAGLVNDGYQVVNVFPYDADGKPIEGVQLFDDRGRPLDLDLNNRGYLSGEGSTYRQLVPGIGDDGQQRWNVYPMREVQTVGPDGVQTPGQRPQDAVRPDPTQAPLLVTEEAK